MKKRCLALLLALCLVAALAVPVLAADQSVRIDSGNLRIAIPDAYTIFTPAAPVQTLPDGTKLDYTSYLAEEQLDLAALNADQSVMLQLYAEPDSSGEFNSLTNKELLSTRAAVQKEYAASGYMLTDYQVYQHSQTKFLRADFTVPGDGNTVYVRLYFTLYQGRQVGVGLQAQSKSAFQANIAAFQTIMDGIRFDKQFTDVKPNAYYAKAVTWAVQHDPVITAGTGDGTTFSPNAGCTRGEMVTFLWRAAGKPTPKSTKNPFTDVKKGAFYYTAVLWAVEEGITSGTGDGKTFSPGLTVDRAQMVSLLWRIDGRKTVEMKQNPFKDVKSGSYYYKAVMWAAKTGITSGTGDGKTFSPSMACSRGQIVTLLYRYYG